MVLICIVGRSDSRWRRACVIAELFSVGDPTNGEETTLLKEKSRSAVNLENYFWGEIYSEIWWISDENSG